MSTESTCSIKDARTVIAGAGPAGYASAIALSLRGFKNITIVERAADSAEFDIGRTFAFGLFARGLKVFQQAPELLSSLQRQTACETSLSVNYIPTHGPPKVISLPPLGGAVLWTDRFKLVRLLQHYMQANFKHINVYNNAAVVDLCLKQNGTHVLLRAANGEETTLPVDLLLACDGARSAVRQSLQRKGDEVVSTNGFDDDVRYSPAVGLRYKTISLGKKPVLSAEGTCTQVAEPSGRYVIEGNKKGRPRDSIFKIRIQPASAKDEGIVRTAVIIQKENHKLWSVRDVEECYKLFEENHPQLQVRNLIPREEMERFVAAKVSSFQPIRRSTSLVGHFKNASGGVVLLGDAAHSFPPDLGQGLNSALEDVWLLGNVIDKVGTDASPKQVIDEYEKVRDEDTWALMYLMVHGAPYQYRQSKWHIAHSLNFLLREKLSSLAPALFHRQITPLVFEGHGYSDVRRMADKTTRNIFVATVVAASLPVIAHLLH